MRRLQAQTLPDATPPIGKIQPFSKMPITFEPVRLLEEKSSLTELIYYRGLLITAGTWVITAGNVLITAGTWVIIDGPWLITCDTWVITAGT